MVSVLKIVSDQLPDDPINSYIHDLGMRVRTVRKTKGMSRKTLAEVSGISERYLAQLETGSGNISISLLLKVALALETPIEALVADGKSERAEFASLFQLGSFCWLISWTLPLRCALSSASMCGPQSQNDAENMQFFCPTRQRLAKA